MASEVKIDYNDFWLCLGRKRQWHYYGGRYCEEYIDFNRVDTYEVDPDRYEWAYRKRKRG